MDPNQVSDHVKYTNVSQKIRYDIRKHVITITYVTAAQWQKKRFTREIQNKKCQYEVNIAAKLDKIFKNI